MSGKRKTFAEKLDASALSWTPGGRRLIQEIRNEIADSYMDGYMDGCSDGKAEGFVAGVQARQDEEG